jgi:hypothetical protein
MSSYENSRKIKIVSSQTLRQYGRVKTLPKKENVFRKKDIEIKESAVQYVTNRNMYEI